MRQAHHYSPLLARRNDQQIVWVWNLVEGRLLTRLRHHPGVRELSSALEHDARNGNLTGTVAAEQILDALSGHESAAAR